MYLLVRLYMVFFLILLNSTVVIAQDSVLQESKKQAPIPSDVSRSIEESPQLDIKIIINGLNNAQKQNALAYLELRKNLDNPHFSEIWLKKLHNKADKNIKDALQPFGYYQANVSKTLKQMENNQWLAQYDVKPGEPVKVTQLNIVISEPAQSDPQVKAILEKFPLKKDSILIHSQYDSARDALIADIGRLGYSKIKTHEHKVIINPRANTAEIHIILESGYKYTLGHFNFIQDNILSEDFILSYLQDIKPGIAQSQEVLLEFQNKLLRTGYFSKVEVQPDFEHVNQENEVPINITLEPSKRHKFSLGGGFDTEIQTFLLMRWQHRRINQDGHYADASTKLSAKKSFIRGAYWIPINDPRTDKIGLISKLETEDTDTTDRTTFDMEAGYWFEWQEWNASLFTEYKLEKFTSGTEPQVTTELFSLGARFERVNFEKALFPRRGWGLQAELRGAKKGLLSDIDYLRLHLKGRVYVPISENGRLLLRGELGLAETNDFDLYPSSLRFYAGGDQSVRGYKWKALGPVDDDGNVVGGLNVMTGSIEYDHKVATDWIIAGFVDAGNAYNNKLDTVFYGAGFGARYISTVGLVRADFGFPIKKQDDISDDKVVFYFGFEMSL